MSLIIMFIRPSVTMSRACLLPQRCRSRENHGSLRARSLRPDDAPYEPNLCETQVKKICAIAHIALDPDGEGTFDAASATRDVGAMLRTMQSMRTAENPEDTPKALLAEVGTEDAEAEPEGPWGNAATWTAPLHEVDFPDARIHLM